MAAHGRLLVLRSPPAPWSCRAPPPAPRSRSRPGGASHTCRGELDALLHFFLQWIEMRGFWGERVAYIYYDGEELKEQ